MNQIWLLLGLKPEGFRAGLKRARDDTKGFESDWKSLKKVFAAGGIATLALGFLKSFAADAQAARDELVRMGEPIPRTTLALAELGDAMERFKTLASTSVGYVAAGWQDLFNFIASGINRVRGISESQENQRMAGYAAAEAAEKNLAKVREENSPEKIAAAEKRLAVARRDSAMQAADTEGKMNILLQENIRLRELVNTTGEHSIRGAEARIALEKNLVEIRKTDADLTKEQAARQKAIDDQTIKNWDEMIRREKEKAQTAKSAAAEKERAMEEEQRRLEEIARIRLKGEENLTEEDKLQLDLLEGRLTKEKQLAELIMLTAKLVAGTLTPAEEDRLRVLVAQTQQTDKQLKNTQLITKNAQDQLSLLLFSMRVRGKEQFKDSDEDSLRELIRRNEENIRRQEFRKQLAGPLDVAVSFITQADIARMQLENENLRQELADRTTLRRDFQLGGVTRARRNFKGDPLLFEEALQRAQGQWDKQDEANQLLREIKTGLTNREGGLSQLPDQVRDLTSATKAVAVQLAQRGIRS